MMRINLLPPEVLERRKAEKGIGYVVLAAVGVALILAVAWGFGFMRLQDKEGELATLQQEVQTTQAQANQLAIFEERAVELDARKAVVTQALGDRRNWGRLCDELSLVLPSDVWVQTLQLAEDDGLLMTGYALDNATDTPDAGHIPVAKLLVRLADLEMLQDAWLSGSSKGEFEERPAITFSVTAGVKAPVVAPDGDAQ